MPNTKDELRFQLIKDIFDVNQKVKQPLKVDRRKIKRKAPANHPWRQYKSAGASNAI